ncbi:dual specificity protein phosphatase family protein [bacterium]|nr:dual specificity protein phosphatase family protein [bacterium]
MLPMPTWLGRLLDGLAVIIVAIAVGWGGILFHKHQTWKQFAEVVPGRVYRSGLLRSEQLARAIDRYHLRTVICLSADEAPREAAICAERGIRFLSFEMHSSGFGKPEDFKDVVRILADSESQPVLVHCRAGVARTGASIALYRMSVDGWDSERALAELRSFEKWGRCESPLEAMIGDYYQRDFVPKLARR